MTSLRQGGGLSFGPPAPRTGTGDELAKKTEKEQLMRSEERDGVQERRSKKGETSHTPQY